VKAGRDVCVGVVGPPPLGGSYKERRHWPYFSQRSCLASLRETYRTLRMRRASGTGVQSWAWDLGR
jgi:hypothetical protein